MGTIPTATAVDPGVLSGATALVIAALLLLLYFYRKRHYILYWTGGWLLVAAARFVVLPAYANEPLRWMVYGVSQFLAIAGALAFVVSADAYRTRPRFRQVYGMMILPVLIWFALAPLALGRSAAFAPGHTLIAGALGAAGFAYIALLRQARLFGAIAIAASMLGLAVANFWIALGVRAPEDAAYGPNAYVTLGFYLVAALGMQLMTFEDMTYELRVTNRELEAAQSELRDLVTTDPLTSCRNRRFFDEVIGRELERHRRYRIPLSLLFVDVDRFKAINDTLGHEAGDRVLQQVAAFLVHRVREADYVFRWGGDEFLILISCKEEEAQRKGAELQASFGRSSKAVALPEGVGLSIGCTEVPPEARDIMPIVKEADERMYADKKRSRSERGRVKG
jgi:diguanylate cyclase (GGDEF)-like protein